MTSSSARLADAIVGAATVQGVTTPEVRGADWHTAQVTAVGNDGTVDCGTIRARRLDSYTNPTIGDLVTICRSGAGNWIALGRLAATGDGAYLTYTPAWTGTTNPGLGNGTLTGRWTRIGRTIIGSINLTIGSTTTGGSGSWAWDLPVVAASGNTRVGVCEFIGNFGRYDGHGVISPNATQIGIYLPRESSGLAALARVGATASPASPGSGATYANSWAAGDQLRIELFYEAAT